MLLPFYYTPHGYGRFDTHRSTLRRIAWDKLRWSSDVEVPDIPDASDGDGSWLKYQQFVR